MSSLTSLLIPCHNELACTRLCLQSILAHTRPPFEIILIDNGSNDGTAQYLAGFADSSGVPVQIITNPTNRGFPAAINQGLAIAQGEFLVLLNNDTVLTADWLDHLIGLAKGPTGREAENATAPIGLVGPMSNYASPPQLVPNVPYTDLDAMHQFAQVWSSRHRGEWFLTPKLSGFCLLMKRAVVEAIGGLDERFGPGLFDDDDLALRARQAGFSLAVAHDVFIHHFGSRTFMGAGIDAERLLEENQQKFAEKWRGLAIAELGQEKEERGARRVVSGGERVTIRPWSPGSGEKGKGASSGDLPSGAPIQSGRDARAPRKSGSSDDSRSHPHARAGSGRRLDSVSPSHPTARVDQASSRSARKARVSLTMIVRDEERNLPNCLESVRGIFDEIVIVDTGSVDRTREIAAAFGARVFDFVWVNDFAAARNAALARATGDYVFWLDADDVIEPPEREKLVKLLGQLRWPDDSAWRSEGPRHVPPAYVVKCACDPGEDGTGGQTVVDHIRLFPLSENVRWSYRVHEQILPALRRARVPVLWSDVTVRHTGYVDRALRLKKLERDERILREELEERPEDPFVLFNLGSAAIERRDWREALGLLRRSLAGSAATDSITRKLYALIARAHQMLGELATARRVCEQGLEVDPDDGELLFRLGMVHRQAGDSAQARACWERILELERPERFASVDQGIFGHLTRRNLAALALEREDVAEAVRQWRAILDERPGDGEALDQLRRLGALEPIGSG